MAFGSRIARTALVVPVLALALASTASAIPVINEFVANHVGTDTHEYIELFGDPNTPYTGYAVVQIEGDGGVAGVLDSEHTPWVTNAFGYAWTGFMTNALENGTMTLLLVSGYTGVPIGTDLDPDNDGDLDLTPWGAIVDGVGVFDGNAGDHNYGGATVLTPGFDGNPFIVGGASRIPNGVDTDAVADWMRNDFDGFGLPGFPGTPVVGEAINTPNARNRAVPEPATLLLFGSALLAAARRRRR